MNTKKSYTLIGGGVGLVCVSICIYLLGWIPEGGAGVMIPIFCGLGAVLGSLMGERKQ